MKTTSAFDLGLIFVGLMTLAIGLYRVVPLQLNRSFWRMNGPLLVMMVLSIICLLINAKGKSLFPKAINISISLAGKFLPMMVLLVIVMALGSVITKIYEKQIADFVLKHHIAGPFIAALVTPTSSALIPVIESLWSNAVLRPVCLFYLQASALMGIPLFMLRRFGFTDGSPIAMRMYFAGLVASVGMLILNRPIFWIVERICQFAGIP